MSRIIVITGSEGLVGRALTNALVARGEMVSRCDVRAPADIGQIDVCDPDAVGQILKGCHGVVHLAAVSRVIWGERNPELCWATNVNGTRIVLEAALTSPQRPWVIIASSREVYGQAERLPATEDSPLRPLNIYGRSKVAAERLVDAARTDGLRTAILRLSTVYGSTRDYPDRVIPAFARSAVAGKPLRVDGACLTIDATHVEDTVRGILALVNLLEHNELPPPIQLVTGRPATLHEIAQLAIQLAGSTSKAVEAEPRPFDVTTFWGDPARAYGLLGWKPEIALREGLARLVEDFRRKDCVGPRCPTRGLVL